MELNSKSPDRDKCIQAHRIVTGCCPDCDTPTAVLNWHEAWPLVHCRCGWTGPTTELTHRARIEPGELKLR